MSVEKPVFGTHLLVRADSIETLVHDGDPSVFRREDEEGHEGLAQVVKVVLVVDPPVAFVGQLQALSFVFDQVRVRAFAVKEDSFE